MGSVTDLSIVRRAEHLGHRSHDSGRRRASNRYVEHRWATGPELLCDDLTAAWWRGWDKAEATLSPISEAGVVIDDSV